MRIAKVIATTFAPRSVRLDTTLAGNPLGHFSHSQNFTTGAEIIDLINFTLEVESKANPGCNLDIIFVNNQIGWKKGDQFLDNLNGTRTNHGKIRILHRENIGLSYGAYDHAFSLFQDEYDYFIFTEDDIIITGDDYALQGLETFNRSSNCGFVAYVGLSNVFASYSPEDSLHAHSGAGLTSSSVLKEVHKAKGSLGFSRSYDEQDRLNIIRLGEVAFVNNIYKLGYEITEIDKHVKLYEHSYDLMRGIYKPRYASRIDLYIYKLKQYLYKFLIIRKAAELKKIIVDKISSKNI